MKLSKYFPTFARFFSSSEARSAVSDAKLYDYPEHKRPNFLADTFLSLEANQKYIEVGSGKVWATFRALDVIATRAQAAEFMMKREGSEAYKPRPDSIEARITKNPNPYDTFEEMLYQLVFHLKLTGTAFWLKDEMDSKGKPKYLFPLLPQYMRIIGGTKIKIDRFEYRINGKVIVFQPNEILYFRKPSPKDQISGIGDVQGAQNLFESYLAYDKGEEQFVKNGAQPSAILSYKGDTVDAEDWEKLKAKFFRDYGGAKNVGKIAFMTGDWSYQRLGLTPAEIQTIEKQQITVEQIFMAHGVPLSVIGASNAANYATAQIDMLNFNRHTVLPVLNLLINALNNGGIFEEGVKLDFELEGTIDTKQVVEVYSPLLKLGVVSPNEIRKMIGIQPVKDNPAMDAYYYDGVPIGQEAAASQPVIEAAPSEAKCAHIHDTKRVDTLAPYLPFTTQEQQGIIDDISRKLDEIEERSYGVYADFLKRKFRGINTTLEERLRNSLDIQSQLSREARASIWEKAIAEAVRANSGTLDVASILGAAALQAFVEISNRLGHEVTPAERREIGRRLQPIVGYVPGVNQSTRERLAARVRELFEEGKDDTAILTTLADEETAGDASRVSTIATTEIGQSLHQAAAFAYYTSGLIATVQVVGCKAREKNSPQYNGQSTCNITGVPVADAASLQFHPNHTGKLIPETWIT